MSDRRQVITPLAPDVPRVASVADVGTAPGRAPSRPPTAAWRLVLHLAASAAGATAVVLGFPLLLGTTWSAVGTTTTSVPTPILLSLAALWCGGLAAHTITLTAAMPGLTHRRALLLSLTGSAVANVLPVGGAAGIAVNHRMTRSWGFSNAAFVTYTVVTNTWDVFAKAFAPLLLLPVIAAAGGAAHRAEDRLATSALILPVVGVVLLAALLHPGTFPSLRRRVERVSPRWGRRLGAMIDAVETARARSAALARRQWPRLSLGMAAYTVLLLLLLVACLHATGASAPLGLVVVAFCAERLLTLIGLTPGGLGLVELGLAGVLMLSPAVSGTGVASGVLLYRLLTFGLEIPVGGVLLAGWTWRRLRIEAEAPR